MAEIESRFDALIERRRHERERDAWFRQQVQEALDDSRHGIPHDEVITEAKARLAEAVKRAD